MQRKETTGVFSHGLTSQRKSSVMKPQHPSPAQFIEKFMNRVAVGVFLISLAYASSAMMFVVSEAMALYLDRLSFGFGLLAVAVVFPSVVKMIIAKRRAGAGSHQPDGFVVDAYKRAAERGFALTFVFLLLMDFLTGRFFVDLPAEFAIQIILAISLAIFSLSFFIFTREEGDEEPDNVDMGAGS